MSSVLWFKPTQEKVKKGKYITKWGLYPPPQVWKTCFLPAELLCRYCLFELDMCWIVHSVLHVQQFVKNNATIIYHGWHNTVYSVVGDDTAENMVLLNTQSKQHSLWHTCRGQLTLTVETDRLTDRWICPVNHSTAMYWGGCWTLFS